MMLLSVMRKFRTILTFATSLMILPCSFCPKITKEKVEVIEHMEEQRYKHRGIFNVFLVLSYLIILMLSYALI